ncbi:hypothetical protein GGQ88_000484 [Novosphingobium hassiacum]|uniref:Lipoprotein n=1 Tax=Novosphingobium hassiacum TaxID=173676 RepID=A0A7W5ZVJ9_9SPHN|nr:hypothetical protein [Novosphingobium hassiacum]MBB3859244.1 hypothetical protein [Novosphingobium hassiacum]
MTRFCLPLLLAPLALAACSDPAPDPSAAATPSLAPMVSESEALAPPVAPGASEAAPVAAVATFPAGMRGKWGMNTLDCDPSRGDDKGAMTVSAKSVKFFESIAEIGAVSDSTTNALRAKFDYEGEGMAWQREAKFELVDGGTTLILTEYGADAPQGPRRYARCGAKG